MIHPQCWSRAPTSKIRHCPLAWNSLPTSVRNSSSLSSFKSALKAHPFIWLYIYCVWSCNHSTVLSSDLESVCACYGAIEINVIIIIIALSAQKYRLRRIRYNIRKFLRKNHESFRAIFRVYYGCCDLFIAVSNITQFSYRSYNQTYILNLKLTETWTRT